MSAGRGVAHSERNASNEEAFHLLPIWILPSEHGSLREPYPVPGIAETVNLTHIKRHDYESHGTINPIGIVPVDPELNLNSPHGRS